ncbi:hypothetical protein NFI96_010293 [Prochilodus magdalenae]|nr:hypothetical protein NFI96_010293 [Prochilodus magdalenae]
MASLAKLLEHPHTVPADGAVGVEVEGHQAFWRCDYRPFILVLTTVPPHTDSLGVSTKAKAGLCQWCCTNRIPHDTMAEGPRCKRRKQANPRRKNAQDFANLHINLWKPLSLYEVFIPPVTPLHLNEVFCPHPPPISPLFPRIVALSVEHLSPGLAEKSRASLRRTGLLPCLLWD